MPTLILIALIIIAYLLWRIYRQKENEKYQAKVDKHLEKRDQEKKELAEKYPHLIGKLEGNWLEVFANNAKQGVPLLKLMFVLFVQESTKIDFSEGSLKIDNLWNVSLELLEHLDKFHEGSETEHEIALIAYWQIATEAIGELIKKNPAIDGSEIEKRPFTEITQIALWFPRKTNHPTSEIAFSDEEGFPRKSKGSVYVKEKFHALGL